LNNQPENFFNRSSNYERDRGTSDIKKRLDDFPPKRDDSYSKRDSYKSSRDDFKSRELDLPRHSTSSYGGGPSSRIESGSSLSKDRYSERQSSDYRGVPSRSDDRDSRNGSSKPRYLDPPAESRFNERSTVASSGAWNSGASHQAFGLGHNAGEIWAPKQPESNPSAWRGTIDDNRYDRFSSNDRKPIAIPTSQFIDSSSVRTNQFIGGGSNIIPASRFGNNRYDNGRF
jgi:hypothetical protein